MNEGLSTAVSLIKEFEGCSLQAYEDGGGILTIGYGCAHDVKPGMTITQEQAESRLCFDVASVAARVGSIIDADLSPNKFAACVSLAYNIGCGAFAKSTLLEKLNAGDLAEAADEFLRWNKIKGKESKGLLRRREAERELFLRA